MDEFSLYECIDEINQAKLFTEKVLSNVANLEKDKIKKLIQSKAKCSEFENKLFSCKK